MTLLETRRVELAMADRQITLCDRTTDNESRRAWGSLNRAQGALLHPDSLTFDTLSDADGQVRLHLGRADCFELDPRAIRAIVAPFVIARPDQIDVVSGASRFAVAPGMQPDLKPGQYQVYFEMCKGDDVFYTLTLIKQSGRSPIIAPRYLLGDEWGAKKERELVIGKASRPFTMKLGRMQKYLYSLGVPKTYQILVNLPKDRNISDISNMSDISEKIRGIGWHDGGCWCIAHDLEPGEGWTVFYCERGTRFDVQTFSSEADACHALVYLV